MTKEYAEKVYDILVKFGKAAADDKDNFILHHADTKYGTDEWRFIGNLGFGGKYYRRENRVTCYPEDETLERKKIIKKINKALSEIKES